jgi:hypothetical protein
MTPILRDEKPVPPILQDGEIDRFLSTRVCARCYNDLVKRPVANPRGWSATCHFCGDAWHYTTVSRRYAEQLGQQALSDHRTARDRFADIVPNVTQGKTPEQLLSELGF